MPALWWLLLSLCSLLGVATWWFHNFTDKEDVVKLTAFSGIACMLSLVGWTWTMDI